jgi:hypothetical protein
MDVAPEREALFNQVYDTEHVPKLKEVPGVIAVARFKTVERRTAPLVLSIDKAWLHGPQ